MHEPGWYTDPAGTPGRLRWWDGQRWTNELRDDPASGIDALLDGDATGRPARPARILGYGALAVSMVAVAAGLSTAAGSLGRGVPTQSGTRPVAMATASTAARQPTISVPTPAVTSATATAPPEQAAPSGTEAPDTDAPAAAPAEIAQGCDGVTPSASALSDGDMALRADERWAREAVPSWLSCGEGGRLLAGEGTARIWVARVGTPDLSETNLAGVGATMYDRTLMEIGTYRTLTHEESDHTVAGIPAHRVTATAGGGQEPTQQVSVIVLDTESAHTTVVIAVADTDDGEGMRATQEALDTLVATTP